MNILDIAQNSVRAEAKLLSIIVDCQKNDDLLTIIIQDNGKGMDEAQLKKVTDPFFTTRTTRAVGLGVPFFKMAAEMSGGSFNISSEPGQGTTVTASFIYSHIDRPPLGSLAETIGQLICLNEEIEIQFIYKMNGSEFKVLTNEFTSVLEDVPLNTPQVMQFVCGYIQENMNNLE